MKELRRDGKKEERAVVKKARTHIADANLCPFQYARGDFVVDRLLDGTINALRTYRRPPADRALPLAVFRGIDAPPGYTCVVDGRLPCSATSSRDVQRPHASFFASTTISAIDTIY